MYKVSKTGKIFQDFWKNTALNNKGLSGHISL